MEDCNLSMLKKKRCALRIARKNRGMNHESHTLGGATGGKTVTAHPQDRLYLYLTLGTWLSPPGSNIEMRQQYVSASIRRSCKKKRVNPGTPHRRERIRMQHAERRTCRSGRTVLLLMLRLSSSMTKHDDLHLPKISELRVSARW